jgi:OmpR family response regulator RpaB
MLSGIMEAMQHLLLIDDDEALGSPLARYLERFNFKLEQALRPSQGLQRLQSSTDRNTAFDAVILDVMLPERDGFAVCRAIRDGEAGYTARNIPIIMLTARGELSDRVVGLELGADDYLAKPFEPRELAARLQTVMRRSQPAVVQSKDAILEFEGGLRIHPLRREVVVQGQPVLLTSTEFDVLFLLAQSPGKVFSRDDILNQLHGHDAEMMTRAVDILISRIRQKLEPLQPIKTLRHVGYTLALVRLA